jgi:hypothetical protein
MLTTILNSLSQLVASCRRSLTCFDDLSPEVERIVRHSFNQAVRDSFGMSEAKMLKY